MMSSNAAGRSCFLFLLVAGLFLQPLLARRLPRPARSWCGLATVAGCVGIAAIASLYPLRFYRHPTSGEIDRRIEARQQAGSTRPCWCKPTGLPSVRTKGGAFRRGAVARASARAWRRALAAVSAATCRAPACPARSVGDSRGVAALLLVTAFAFSFGPLGGKLSDGFKAHGWMETVPPRIDAWVTPPGYTGKAPVFLTSNSNAQAAGQGQASRPTRQRRTAAIFLHRAENSELSLRVSGGSGAEHAAPSQMRLATQGTIAPQGAPEGAERRGSQCRCRRRRYRPARRACGSLPSKLTADGVLTLKSGERNISKLDIRGDRPTIRR